jgi:hypothetical protein
MTQVMRKNLHVTPCYFPTVGSMITIKPIEKMVNTPRTRTVAAEYTHLLLFEGRRADRHFLSLPAVLQQAP